MPNKTNLEANKDVNIDVEFPAELIYLGALHYLTGDDGREVNIEEAIRCLVLALDKGYAEAGYKLGTLYYELYYNSHGDIKKYYLDESLKAFMMGSDLGYQRCTTMVKWINNVVKGYADDLLSTSMKAKL